MLIVNEYVDEEEKRLNVLNYYIYDKNLKYQFLKKEEINFEKIAKKLNLDIDNFDLFNCIKNIKKFKNGKIFLFTVNTIPFKEKQEFDDLNRSLYERDVELYLNIYLYENKELTLIYKKIYKKHFVYDNSIYESEYADFLKIFNDENLLINEKDGLISFYNANLSNYVTVNIEEKKGRKIVLDAEGFKQCIFDRKSNCCYLVRSFEDLEEQTIALYQITEKKLDFTKLIYLPYIFKQILLTKKGNLLGVAKNTITVYSFYHHLERYAPSRTINTSLCLLNISI